MKTLIKYQSKDGTEFRSEAEALDRDMLVDQVDLVMSVLGERNTSHVGWVQHDPSLIDGVKEGILAICRHLNMGNTYPCFNEHGSKVHPFSIVGRILDDWGGPLNAAWARIMCIDSQGREHQQPFYAMNGPDSGQKCLEDRR